MSNSLNKRPSDSNTDTVDKKIKMSTENNNTTTNTNTADNAPSFQSIGTAASLVDDMAVNPHYGAKGEGISNTGAADAEGHPVQEIESLCMNCHENGFTRMLLTKIPYFREVVIMSFSCPHCGFHNSEIQPASEMQLKGSKYTLKIETAKDLGRQVIKSDYCDCRFPELDIEIPPKRGQLSSPEGLLNMIKEDLEGDQPVRKHVDPELHDKIQAVIDKIQKAIDGEILPLTLVLDDPTGNSWIEFVPGEPTHKWSHVEYFRTKEQNNRLGIQTADGDETTGADVSAPVAHSESGMAPVSATAPELIPDSSYVPMGTTAAASANSKTQRNESQSKKIEEEVQSTEKDDQDIRDEVQTFNAVCPVCNAPTPTHMKVVNIPHFKDVILMSTVCDHCGYKSNDVKTGGAIPEKGRKIKLKVTDPDDLTRDILKSESAGLSIPELRLDLTPGTLGGRFTTLEGLLRQVHDELESRVFTERSDSMDETTRNNWKSFLDKLDEAADGKIEFNVEIMDPLAGSYIQNPYAPDPDPYMTIEDYERTHEQNEDLGLNDMVVD